LDGPGEGTELVPTLYDAYPEAFPKLYTEYILEGNQFVSDTLPFLLEQMQYLQQFNQCTLPLHYALMNDEPLPLGTIKLLANAQRIDEECPTRSTLPLHLACMFSTLNVVKYLVGQNNTLLGEKDSEGNYPLHHACIGGNLKIIYYLVKQDGATESMSTANKDGDSPINLLVKYAPSAFKFPPITFFLLQAMPQTVSQLTAIEIDSDDEDLFWSDQEDLSDDDQPY
jgi:ankyrin repeat protein